eukprot:TRINITY_DN5671_c0_g1_i1.p1 TRINITY_DN5671_c0_g1~~TRINITY_DN5671_c0_g1_i1.p1  ORF type:complete len:155 (+),score=33.39 TRINITY_DN5671_c0_g1_i1:741-1205(+)
MLAHLEEQNREHELLLQQLLSERGVLDSSLPNTPGSESFRTPPQSFSYTPTSRDTSPMTTASPSHMLMDEEQNFETSLRAFLNSYRQIKPDERPAKVRRVLAESFSDRDVATVSEFLTYFCTAPLCDVTTPIQDETIADLDVFSARNSFPFCGD